MFNPVAAKDIEVGNMIVENTRPLEIGTVIKVTPFSNGEEVSIETDRFEHITGTFALYMASQEATNELSDYELARRDELAASRKLIDSECRANRVRERTGR